MTTAVSKPYSVPPPCIFKPLRNSPPTSARPAASLFTHLPLRSVLPKSYTDYYTADILSDSALLTPQGRPLFTQRDLVDWTLNDTRSLLIVPELRPEWRGVVPRVIEPGYRVQVLPLDATDDELVQGLVSSDIYAEHKFEHSFLVQTAEYTVQAARARNHGGQQTQLSKPEWRNVIENYLLNLACEAQCRIDFKRKCAELKRLKRDSTSKSTAPSSAVKSTSPGKSTSPLLKQAIMTSLSVSPDFSSSLDSISSASSADSSKKKASLSRLEKQQIWVTVQTLLYKRLGLNWQADELV